MESHQIFYLDWTFWTVIMSLIAVILSQLPPIHLLLRPRRLSVEVHSRIQVGHLIGNPSASMVMDLRNTGGRILQIQKITLNISRNGVNVALLPGQVYFETPSSQQPVLFVPFTIKPEDSWSHSVSFFKELDRLEDKELREMISKMRSYINAEIQKNNQKQEQPTEPVAASADLYSPFLEMLKTKFIWLPGEYTADLEVVTSPDSASFSKCYRFMLFESDTNDLKNDGNFYKFGDGIYYRSNQMADVRVPISGHAN